jgi:microsomal dipeptidase-like Zn-dependent dipeptidase
MEIATSPSQARRIIRQGKLAVVLGLEVDALGNWRQTNAPTPAQYQAEVQRLFDQGVRHLFPVHFADNAFGGSAVSGDLFNVNNFYFNGKFQDVISGDSIGLSLKLSAPTVPVTGNYLNFNNGGRLTVAAVSDGYNRVRGQYSALRSHRNALGGTGLTAAGLDKMMSLGLIVDIDHMSQSLREQVLSQCEAASVNGVRGYPVVCGHTAFRELSFSQGETRDSHLHAAEMDQSAPLARRILGLGGMISVITCEKNVKQSPGSSVPADAPGTSKATAQLLHFASNLSGPERGIGIGTDLAMLGGFGPRFGVNAIHSEVAAGGLPGIVAGPLGLPADSTDAEKSAAQLRRTSRALSERNGVIYDQPVLDHYRYRYFYSRDYRGYERKAIHTAVQRDFLESLAIVSAGKTGETANQPGLLEGRAIVTSDTINAFCKGLRATRVEDADGYTIFKTFRNEMRAAFLVKSGNSGAGEGAGVRNVMGQIKPIWDSWQLMRTNPAHPAPLKKLVYSGTADGKPYSRDFDINLDGFAHYGMLPDALQELTNVGLDGGTRTAMFRGAEQYLKTWEKAWSMRR